MLQPLFRKEGKMCLHVIMAWVPIHTQPFYSCHLGSFCFQEERKERKGEKTKRGREGRREGRRERKRGQGGGKKKKERNNSHKGSPSMLLEQVRPDKLPPPRCPAWPEGFSSQLPSHPNSSRIMQIHIGDLFFFLIEMQLLVQYTLLTFVSHFLDTR